MVPDLALSSFLRPLPRPTGDRLVSGLTHSAMVLFSFKKSSSGRRRCSSNGLGLQVWCLPDPIRLAQRADYWGKPASPSPAHFRQWVRNDACLHGHRSLTRRTTTPKIAAISYLRIQSRCFKDFTRRSRHCWFSIHILNFAVIKVSS